MNTGTYAPLADTLRSELSASTYERLEAVLKKAGGDAGGGHLSLLLAALDQSRGADLTWEEATRQDEATK